MLWSIESCQNDVSADQNHMTILRVQVQSSSSHMFFVFLFFFACMHLVLTRISICNAFHTLNEREFDALRAITSMNLCFSHFKTTTNRNEMVFLHKREVIRAIPLETTIVALEKISKDI